MSARMSRLKSFIDAPRMEVVLVPDDGTSVNKASSLFDLWLVLRLPDGKPPETICVDGGPFDRDSVCEKLAEIWMTVGERFAGPAQQR